MKRLITEKLNDWKDKADRKPLILKGARQVGKTYILQDFGQAAFSQVHYLNFERDTRLAQVFEQDLDPVRIINELSFYFDRSIEVRNDLLIFDEIQECPRALTSLKYFYEQQPELAICAAGSLLGVQLTPGSYPVGKVEEMTLYPMTFEEFLSGIGDEKLAQFIGQYSFDGEVPSVVNDRLWSRMKDYFVVGGLPEAILTFAERRDARWDAFQAVREIQNRLVNAYIADMAKHSGQQNAMHIDRLWRNVPNQLAKNQDGSAKRFQFKGVVPSVNRYGALAGVIDWLQSAGLVLKCPIANSGELPFSAHTKENMFKLYMFDVGLLGALSQLSPKTLLDYTYGTYKGYFAENFVAQELLSGNWPIYGWAENRAELEFLLDFNGEVVGIEVKSGHVTQAKSLGVFARKYAPCFQMVLSGRNYFEKGQKTHVPLYLVNRLGDYLAAHSPG